MPKYQRSAAEKELRLIAMSYNNLQTRLNNILNYDNKTAKDFATWQQKTILILKLHGYGDMALDVIKDDFLMWLSNNLDQNYIASKMNFSILEEMSTSFYLFKLNNEREPESTKELKEYILKERKND